MRRASGQSVAGMAAARPSGLAGGTARLTESLAVTLGVAAASWVVAVRQMAGMDMGVGTDLGSFTFFIGLWLVMMAAMMLPGAVPAVVNRVESSSRMITPSAFVVSYLAVWTLVGVAVYGLYRPHGTVVAGVAVIVAGAYELTPIKRHFRRSCRDGAGSGFGFGAACVGSSIGLMLLLVALGPMSLTWMTVIAVFIIAQKLIPPRPTVDVTVALAIVVLGILILLAPSYVPGLMPPM